LRSGQSPTPVFPASAKNSARFCSNFVAPNRQNLAEPRFLDVFRPRDPRRRGPTGTGAQQLPNRAEPSIIGLPQENGRFGAQKPAGSHSQLFQKLAEGAPAETTLRLGACAACGFGKFARNSLEGNAWDRRYPHC
jgi:hypothetical protein